MLYYLLVPLAKDHIVFNVFRYLTFRSFMALITAFIISLVVGPWIIRQLRIAQAPRWTGPGSSRRPAHREDFSLFIRVRPRGDGGPVWGPERCALVSRRG